MPLWGTKSGAEHKPKHLTEAEKKNCFATPFGWVLRRYRNAAKTKFTDELLVAIKKLTTSLGAANITNIEFLTTSYSKTAGGNIDVEVNFNEAVDVVTSGGTPRVTVTNNQAGTGTDATFLALYISGTGTNKLTFRKTYAPNATGVKLNDVLTLGTDCLSLNSGTIKDAGTATDAVITSTANPAITLTAIA